MAESYKSETPNKARDTGGAERSVAMRAAGEVSEVMGANYLSTVHPAFPFRWDEFRDLVDKHGEANGGVEDFCKPWWDSELSAWCVSCRYADCGLRLFADGWEYAMRGPRFATATEAYEANQQRAQPTWELAPLPPEEGRIHTVILPDNTVRVSSDQGTFTVRGFPNREAAQQFVLRGDFDPRSEGNRSAESASSCVVWELQSTSNHLLP